MGCCLCQPKGRKHDTITENMPLVAQAPPQTLRELQNALQVDNSRLRNTVTGMVATGMLSARNGTYVPGFCRDGNTDAPAGPLHTGQAGGPLRLCVPR